MNAPTLPSPAELAAWREQLAQGPVSTAVVQRLLDAVAELRSAAETAEKDALALAAVYVGMRLSARAEVDRCSECGDAEARALAAWLRRAAGVAERRLGA